MKQASVDGDAVHLSKKRPFPLKIGGGVTTHTKSPVCFENGLRHHQKPEWAGGQCRFTPRKTRTRVRRERLAARTSDKHGCLIFARKVSESLPRSWQQVTGASDVSQVMLAFFLSKELHDQSWQIEQCPEGARELF